MKRFICIIDKLNNGIFTFIALLFGVTGLLTIYQVFARYVLKSPLVWSEEVVRYVMIWIVLLGTAIALRKGLLISVETLLFVLPERIKRILQIIIIGLNIIFLLILVNYGFSIMESLQTQKAGALDIPVAWTYAAIPVGSLLALLNCVVVLLELIFNLGKKEDNDGGATIL
jgi:TRAP-type transport system small permease protein